LVHDELKLGPDGTLPLPARPGLGIELDPDALIEFSNAATRMHA
jgi:L-alanine-DL-glutamate epimerase-like enolase superfamily enzyme